MRALVIAALFLVAGCAQPPPSTSPTPSPTREPGTLNVTALLDLSGPRVPSGAPQRDALQLWADGHATGTPRVRLKIVDVGGSGSKTLVELRRAAVDDGADAIVVGAAVRYDDTFARAAQLAGIPVLFTLPIPDPGDGWAFALAPTPSQLAIAALDDAARRTVLTGTLVVSDESDPAIVERVALVDDLARRGVAPTVLKVTSDDAAKLRPIVGTSPVTLLAGPARTYLEALRASTPAGLLYFSYLSEPADVGTLRDVAPLAMWPGSRWIASGATAYPARVAFAQAFAARSGPPTTPAASAYDALTILAGAATDPPTPGAMRDRMERATFIGVATTYSFTPARHAGFLADDLAMLRYAGSRAAPAIRSGAP